MMARQLDDKPAEVGLFYLVPCIHMPGKWMGLSWVPVIGPKHRDVELGVLWEHWHIDWRFVPDRVLEGCMNWKVQSPHGRVISSNHTDKFRQELVGAPELKRRMCRRPMPDFPVAPGPRWAAMEEGMRERCTKLKDGHTCPHRGIDLRPFARPDGTAICPGHGLHWDLRTGELLARHGSATPAA